jgi:hypothetical protein
MVISFATGDSTRLLRLLALARHVAELKTTPAALAKITTTLSRR